MPDAGYYVLQRLSREEKEPEYYATSASKFDQVVKHLINLGPGRNMLESSAGRILGLEAAVKLGGITLERSWVLSHQDFMSTAIHAILAMGISKSDGTELLERLADIYGGDTSGASWWRGYKKLLGWYRDGRLPDFAKRGRNNYQPVTHWTMRQKGGWALHVPQIDEGIAMEEEAPKETIRVKLPKPKDEGYESGPDIIKDGVSSGESEAEPKVESFTFWPRPEKKKEEPQDWQKVLQVDSARVIALSDDDRQNLRTGSVLDFEAAAFPVTSHEHDSLSQQAFARSCVDRAALEAEWAKRGEVPAPDRGIHEVIDIALERPRTSVDGTVVPFPRGHKLTQEELQTPLGSLCAKFIATCPDIDELASPKLLYDGIAGSAKSSALRTYLRRTKRTALVICPTRRLAKEWRKSKVGLAVTRHKVEPRTYARSVLVIDEVYCFTKWELGIYLRHAWLNKMDVVMLGDRQQQYQDGEEVTALDLKMLGVQVLRGCVSNTQPLDALKICRAVASGDPLSNIFQTRSGLDQSIYFEDSDGPIADKLANYLEEHSLDDAILVMKDRLETPLGYRRPETAYGLAAAKESLLSISRSQGLRTENSVVLLSRVTQIEKWLSDQMGLLYVALSRHSSWCLVDCSVSELAEYCKLPLVQWHSVNGLHTKHSTDEHHHRATKIREAMGPVRSDIIVRLMERGALTQTGRFASYGDIIEDWRPWKASEGQIFEVAKAAFKTTTDQLKCATVPFAHSPAARLPHFKPAMGLFSLRRPFPSPVEYLTTEFDGLNRVAVPQSSADEVLDLKNVVERTARPRVLQEDELFIETHGERLWRLVHRCFMTDDVTSPLSTEPMLTDWLRTRTPDFLRKYQTCDPYGLTSQSTRSNGFLKTQVKVKLDPAFAMEENYGQTVLASPPDFNAIFGPYSKMFLRNVRLCTRKGCILDSGYSDKDVAREWRQLGILPRLSEENHQADVSRQDTSHTPVTLRVFRKVMTYYGIPEELAALYEWHSRKYSYSSMKTQLYKGEANYNLGSGDPFTLIRNIFEVLTVLVERYEANDLQVTNCIVKGDDYLSDKIPRKIAMTVPEIRDTILKESFNAPPYHAGRFFLSDDVVPDPLRMIAKIATKKCTTVERYQQLQQSFYDRYLPLSHKVYVELRHYLLAAYDKFAPDFVLSALELYRSLHDRRHYAEIFSNFSQTDAGLFTLSRDGGCAAFALAAVCCLRTDVDYELINRQYDFDNLRAVCARLSIPFYVVRGKPGDFTREGIWANFTHAWAVVDLIKFNELTKIHAI